MKDKIISIDSGKAFYKIQHLFMKKLSARNSLSVQWLGFCTFTAKDPGSIPGRGTKIPKAAQSGQKKPPKTNKQTKNSQQSGCTGKVPQCNKSHT